MTPRIEQLGEKKLVGMSQTMSLANNQTFQLFSTFMPRKKEVQNSVNNNVFDLRIYPPSYFQNFSPASTFTKWALVEVSALNNIPPQMKGFELKGGKYAVFTHKGVADFSVFDHIFSTWLPKSDYSLDNRPHFEIMGENYKMNDPNSEEEIWIPVC